MPEAGYKIIAASDRTFKVVVAEREHGVLCGASGFKTEAAAVAWIKLKQSRTPSGQEWGQRADCKHG